MNIYVQLELNPILLFFSTDELHCCHFSFYYANLSFHTSKSFPLVRYFIAGFTSVLSVDSSFSILNTLSILTTDAYYDLEH